MIDMSTKATSAPDVAADRLSDGELHAWRGMLESTSELRNRLEAVVQKTSGLSDGDYAVLLALTEADGAPLRSSELAATISWERSRLSHHLGRMEKRGLLRRDPCEIDNRGSELRITDVGTAAFRAAAGPHLRTVKSLFADALTPQQIDALGEIVDALSLHLSTTPESTSNDRQRTP
jgi:DNA-binding MarR family transcriptional regulator